VFTFLEPRDVDSAGLKDSSLGHRDFGKAAVAFANRGFSVIEPCYEAATELGDLGEGMRLAPLVDYAKMFLLSS